MKKTILLAISCFALSGVYAQSTVFHLNLGSHNETSDPGSGVNYNNSLIWAQVKAKLNQIADTVEFYNAKWNMQVESNFILACLQKDTAATSVHDILQTFDNHPNIEVDPHNHLDTTTGLGSNPYNYADLAYLLDSCGLNASTVVGGYVYIDTSWNTHDEIWPNYRYGLQGRTFPSYTWTPQILWGGGTANHVNDPFSLGVWHPGGTTNPGTFFTNDPTQLMGIGNGCNWLIEETTDIPAMVAEIQQYLDYFAYTPTTPTTYYCGTVMFNFRDILGPNAANKVCEFIRLMKPYVDNGSVQWQTLQEKKASWDALYPSASSYFVQQCATITTLGNNEIDNTSEINVYPNPASTYVTLEHNLTNSSTAIYNAQGALVAQFYNNNSSKTEFNVASFTSGIYYIKVSNNEQMLVKRLVKE